MEIKKKDLIDNFIVKVRDKLEDHLPASGNLQDMIRKAQDIASKTYESDQRGVVT